MSCTAEQRPAFSVSSCDELAGHDVQGRRRSALTQCSDGMAVLPGLARAGVDLPACDAAEW
jgi:hypothetical protein